MPDALPADTCVSRETRQRLDAFVALLRKWNASISLVSKGDVAAIRDRHIAESVEVVGVAPRAETWADLGSGGGFPGLVAAILHPSMKVTLVESDARKAAFLRTAVRELGLGASVLSERIEAVSPLRSEIVSARALAPLDRLLAYCHRHGRPDATYILPKGDAWRDETVEAERNWRYDMEVIAMSGSGRVILRLTRLEART